MKKFMLLAFLWLSASQSYATELLDIQHQWAHANYEIKDEEQREAAFLSLMDTAGEYVKVHPDDASGLIWLGIVKSTTAGAVGGFDALSLAEEARTAFEQAIELNDKALDGSAYTSLGTLYHKLPGWPVSFGSNKKAQKLLEKALSVNPNGIDPNYFYAELMYDRRKYKMALTHLIKAQNAPIRQERPLADSGRQKEISALMAKVKKKLG